MPLKKIIFKSGVNRENTRYTTEGGWYECDKIRFRQGTPEKVGGWYQISNSTFLGICRALWNWITLASLNVLAVGTSLKYYIESGGTYYDITPLKYSSASTTLTNAFGVTNTLKTVVVTWAGSNLYTGDVVQISGCTVAVGGIPAADFNNQFTVTRIGLNTFQITVTDAATSTVPAGGGTVSITAIRYTVSLTNPFQCFSGSTRIRVTATSHGGISGNFVDFTSTSTFYGVTITGWYQMTVIDANTYDITASTTASTNASAQGGAVTAQYQIDTGTDIAVPLSGWGAGAWGSGSWGFSATTAQDLRLWSQANFGENLVFGPRGGGMYYWTAANGVTSIGINISTIVGASDVPTIQNYIAISDVSRFVFAFGCNDYGSGVQDPMLIRWSDQESITMWTPAATNQAGSLRLSHGSLIVTAMQVRQEILVWTDSSLYSLQYLGAPAVWGSTLLGDNISIVGENATALASGIVYWMGRDKFYRYDGSVSTLSCDLRQFVYGNINLSQASQFFASTNEGFNEVWFFYCSEGSTVIDTYVIYNYLEQVWYYGYLGRTAWLDTGLRNYPLAATYANNIVYHEYGVNDGTTLPESAIDSYIVSSEFDIDDGHNFGFVWRILPDLTFRGSTSANPNVTMTMYPLQNSGSGYNDPLSQGGSAYATVTRTSVVNVEQFTGTIYVRVRGRQMAFKVENNNLGDQWQLGAPRIDIRPDGRRGNT
jgi:hypothetical protein